MLNALQNRILSNHLILSPLHHSVNGLCPQKKRSVPGFLILPLASFSKLCYTKACHQSTFAAVVELADTRDLKSLGSDIVPVQVRSAAPIKRQELRIFSEFLPFFFFHWRTRIRVGTKHMDLPAKRRSCYRGLPLQRGERPQAAVEDTAQIGNQSPIIGHGRVLPAGGTKSAEHLTLGQHAAAAVDHHFIRGKIIRKRGTARKREL